MTVQLFLICLILEKSIFEVVMNYESDGDGGQVSLQRILNGRCSVRSLSRLEKSWTPQGYAATHQGAIVQRGRRLRFLFEFLIRALYVCVFLSCWCLFACLCVSWWSSGQDYLTGPRKKNTISRLRTEITAVWFATHTLVANFSSMAALFILFYFLRA